MKFHDDWPRPGSVLGTPQFFAIDTSSAPPETLFFLVQLTNGRWGACHCGGNISPGWAVRDSKEEAQKAVEDWLAHWPPEKS